MLEISFSELYQKGYLDLQIDPSLNLAHEISSLKKEKNAVILAHYYQDPDIQDIADFIGDSLALAQKAEKADADLILFAGVHFMAETAKILNPAKKVLIPDLKAGCSLADSCPPIEFSAFKREHPEHLVVSYINCSAEIKAMSDLICTSSNAVKIIESISRDKEIIFAPDRNLGKFLIKKTGREMLLWQGSCMVHEIFSRESLVKLKVKHPKAIILAHPECEEDVLEMADFVGSTTAILNYAKYTEVREIIVATEPGIIHQMQKECVDKSFISAPTLDSCGCNNCPHMKLNTIEKIYLALKYEMPILEMDENLRKKAFVPLKRMLELSV